MTSYTAFGSLSNRVTALEENSGPSGSGGMSYIVKVGADSTAENALLDALDDYIGVLKVIVEPESDSILLTASSPPEGRVDGMILRFFNNASVIDASVYSVKETLEGTKIFEILPQEAYSMIWRAATTSWVVVPGIINAKSRDLV